MILSTLMFLAGLHMMIMLLAAAYRYIDLWYRINDFWPAITLRLAVLFIVDIALIVLLPTELAHSFVNGQVCYLVFHIVIYWLIRAGLGVAMIRRDRTR